MNFRGRDSSELFNESAEDENMDCLRDSHVHLQVDVHDLDAEPLMHAERISENAATSEAVEDGTAWKRKPQKRGAAFVRGVALLCACSLSIGSHYAGHILGPLKSQLHRQLGTSHTEFGLLLSVYSLNSTWTPFVGGILASRLGTTSMSILTTGVIFIGQILLLLGDMWGNIRLMACGLFVFGLGSHGLGVSMAMGLVAGKAASFSAARTAYPLSEHFGPRAPFYVSTALAAFSVLVNLVYIALSKQLVDLTGAELEVADISNEAHRRLSVDITEGQALEEVAKKRQVHIRQITHLGDIFWAYIGVNIFCGFIWAPFTQLSANIIQTRYGMSDEASTDDASYLLSGAVVLYPVCGYIVDRRKNSPIVTQLLFASSVLTLLAYIWLALPSDLTRTPLPSIVPFAVALGFSPLLLVVMVPRIVPSEFVSTALGAHKSMEQTGSILLQTVSGILLDVKSGKRTSNSLQYLLNTFVLLNVLQGCSIWLMAQLQSKRSSDRGRLYSGRNSFAMESIRPGPHEPSDTPSEYEIPLLENASDDSNRTRTETHYELQVNGKSGEEIRRGKIIVFICSVLVLSAWALVIPLAWKELGHKKSPAES